jgi:hypothetical protein
MQTEQKQLEDSRLALVRQLESDQVKKAAAEKKLAEKAADAQKKDDERMAQMKAMMSRLYYTAIGLAVFVFGLVIMFLLRRLVPVRVHEFAPVPKEIGGALARMETSMPTVAEETGRALAHMESSMLTSPTPLASFVFQDPLSEVCEEFMD